MNDKRMKNKIGERSTIAQRQLKKNKGQLIIIAP